jgi:aspartyl aminopeptidase
MHSCYETAGTADTSYLIRTAKTFYETAVTAGEDGSYTLS